MNSTIDFNMLQEGLNSTLNSAMSGSCGHYVTEIMNYCDVSRCNFEFSMIWLMYLGFFLIVAAWLLYTNDLLARFINDPRLRSMIYWYVFLSGVCFSAVFFLIAKGDYNDLINNKFGFMLTHPL